MRGRRPTPLTAGEHHAFSRRYTLVREDGFSLIVDNATSERISISKFRRLHGVRGEMWFYSRLLPSLDLVTLGWFADGQPPSKHRYMRQESLA